MNCLRRSSCTTTEVSGNLALNIQTILVITLMKKKRKKEKKYNKKEKKNGDQVSQPGYLKLMGLFNLHKPLHSTESCANEFLNVCEALGYQNDEFHRKADEDINISVFVAGLGQWAVK